MSTTGYTILILIAAVAFWSAWRQAKAASEYDRQEELDYACMCALEGDLTNFKPEPQSSSRR